MCFFANFYIYNQEYCVQQNVHIYFTKKRRNIWQPIGINNEFHVGTIKKYCKVRKFARLFYVMIAMMKFCSFIHVDTLCSALLCLRSLPHFKKMKTLIYYRCGLLQDVKEQTSYIDALRGLVYSYNSSIVSHTSGAGCIKGV